MQPAAVQLASGCTMPDATVGVPYSQALVPDGGTTPYDFKLMGQLPAGLSLTEDGRISGTPRVATSYPFALQVQDSRSETVTSQCAITVKPARFGIASCPLPPGLTGAPYSAQLAAPDTSGPIT